MSEYKQDLTCLFRERPDTPEGKYLVLRRDGRVTLAKGLTVGTTTASSS